MVTGGFRTLEGMQQALREGRIDGNATPLITRPAPAIILSDARRGAAHVARDLVVVELLAVTGARADELCSLDLQDYRRPHPAARRRVTRCCVNPW